jgi:hypothetical protein
VITSRQGIAEAEELEHGVERDQVRERGHHARDQDEHGELVSLRAGDPVPGRDADQERDQRRAAGNHDAVPEVAPHRVLGEHLHEVVERRRVGDEHGRIGEVVDVVLERKRQHPQEQLRARR